MANNLIDRGNLETFLEAEMNLEQLRSGVAGGQGRSGRVGGMEALARMEKKRSPKLAADYYRLLAEQFPDTIVRDGKTEQGGTAQ